MPVSQPVARKQPKTDIEPNPQKRPKWADHHIEGSPLAWRFSACDRGGPFSWAAIEGTNSLHDVISRLAAFEQMTWADIIRARCHPIECHRLEKPARDRLVEINQDDLDELMAFHITGPNRVWCIKDQNIMRVLWWDPEHQVYPVERDKADREKRRRKQGR